MSNVFNYCVSFNLRHSSTCFVRLFCKLLIENGVKKSESIVDAF